MTFNMPAHEPCCINSSRRVGFTVPEMLAVVAILVILIGLLMPSMNWAKYRARSANCVSNKHQIIVGVRSYALDNVNRFPNAQGNGNQYWMQDHPHIVFTAPSKFYGVPLEMWACAVSATPKIPYYWGGYNPAQKWKMQDSAWWVIRGSVGSDSVVSGARPNLVSDRVQQVSSTSVVVSDYATGTTTPTSSPHAYDGKVYEASMAKADGSAELNLAPQMTIRMASEGWGAWWY